MKTEWAKMLHVAAENRDNLTPLSRKETEEWWHNSLIRPVGREFCRTQLNLCARQACEG